MSEDFSSSNYLLVREYIQNHNLTLTPEELLNHYLDVILGVRETEINAVTAPRLKKSVSLVRGDEQNAVAIIKKALAESGLCVIAKSGLVSEQDYLRDSAFELAEETVGYDWNGVESFWYNDLDGEHVEMTLSLIKKND